MTYSTTTRMIVLTAAAASMVAVGCSSSSSAPFHMYSSPLLEGEMETPASDDRADDTDETPGAEPRQVYAYQRWQHQADPEPAATPRRHATGNGGQRGTFDTVQPETESVLASHDVEATGEGTTATDNGRSGDDPSDDVAERRQTDDELDDRDLDAAPDDRNPRGPAADAAAFVYEILEVNDIELGDDAVDSIPSLFRECRSTGETFHTGEPNIGDLVFFHNTYDANDDGRNNDWYTLVGVVENLRADGTVEFLAYHDGDVSTRSLNLDRIEETGADDRILNSRLRDKTADDPPFTQYLAGELFAGYCDILGDRHELILIDQWSPGGESRP